MEESGLVVFEGLWINRYIEPLAINKKMSPNSGMFRTYHTISWYSWETMDFLDKCLLSADVWKIMIAITISLPIVLHFLSSTFSIKSHTHLFAVVYHEKSPIICLGAKLYHMYRMMLVKMKPTYGERLKMQYFNGIEIGKATLWFVDYINWLLI